MLVAGLYWSMLSTSSSCLKWLTCAAEQRCLTVQDGAAQGAKASAVLSCLKQGLTLYTWHSPGTNSESDNNSTVRLQFCITAVLSSQPWLHALVSVASFDRYFIVSSVNHLE